MGPISKLLALALALAGIAAPPVSAQPRPDRTEVIVLGVDHAAQLVNRRHQPAALRAFFSAVAPNAICVERSPERFARGDHYEFTYEIQDVIVPWARETGTPLCPFDWLPNPEDSALAFGIDDLERPPFLRRPSGFQGFVAFPEGPSMTGGLFFADAEEERVKHRAFYAVHPDEPRGDFARRLFLYRTFLQARRIAAAARDHPGGRVLVVVGVMHKDDIERILASDPRLSIVQPSAIAAEPDPAAIARETRTEHLFAIASFNLLGMQSRGDNVDEAWVEETVRAIERSAPGPEVRLLRTRLDERLGRIDAGTAVARYFRIATEGGDQRFSWDGIKDRSRLDSVYDPFANLTVAQRARMEAARIHSAAGRTGEAEAIRTTLRSELPSEFQRLQFDGYWSRYVARVPEPPSAESAT
jgi:hypothetical protein